VHHLCVLSAAQNRKAIEAALRKAPLPNVQFVYVGLPGWLGPLLRHQGALQFYAYLWQWRAYFAARKLNRQIAFDVCHHLTYENDWMASIIGALLPVPYLRGPAGGSHRVPKAFRKQFPAGSHVWEYVRIVFQWVFRHDPFFLLGHGRAKVLLMANSEAQGTASVAQTRSLRRHQDRQRQPAPRCEPTRRHWPGSRLRRRDGQVRRRKGTSDECRHPRNHLHQPLT